MLDNINEKWRLANTVDVQDVGQGNPPFLNLRDIQTQLKETTALLRYIALEQACYVVAITHSNATLSAVQCPQSGPAQNNLSGQEFSKLYKQAKAKSYIPDWLLQQTTIKQLVIVPDAKFQTLPYPLLRLDNNAFTYLGTRYELVQSISLHSYFDASAASTEYAAVAAVFDAPAFYPPGMTSPQTTSGWSNNLSALIWAQKEGDAIEQIFADSNTLRASAADANNEVLMSAPFRQAQILHIATHSYYDPKQSDIVGLATAFINNSKHFKPGFISQNYLLSKPFNNQLVVLSGCETALGHYLESEGHLSLAHGVLSAGAGSTISTLWKVADQATAIFMQEFYRSLSATGNSSVALLRARRAVASNPRYRYPEYWAAFNLKLAHREAENFSF